ncbi:hypothetical protein SCHPADRAFT_890157 [Schizopora paradoxa]|uniref:Ricin B lectin domain-containing protein n=1 Tax=Schizopora paradoxa TaxID=27342 RepID=A0A0H2RMU0_9AGAM|nr:hypothetical protein SCHPADRAFT_890157 [Schizopora paradoxa]
MSAITGTVQDGTYKIKNTNFNSYVNLADNNSGTPLTNTTDGDTATVKWNVKLLDNGNYTIKSNKFPTKEAFASAKPSSGQIVVSKVDTTQWTITETNVEGKYLYKYFLFPSHLLLLIEVFVLPRVNPVVDDTLYWNLENATSTTTVKLQKDSSAKSQWAFVLA